MKSHRFFTLAASLLCLCLFGRPVQAQVPQLINYQGRVAVSGTNFTGAGQFQFALVSGSAPVTTYWSNDGTSTAGNAPTNAVSLPVTKGLYSVLLGDATIPNMTVIPATVFSNADVRLRVWFNDGTHGWQQLTPDQRIAAVGYAMMANTAQTVPDGAITSAKIAPGAVTASNIAPGSITSAQLAPGAVSGSNILTNSVTGSQLTSTAAADSVGAGAFILSDNPSATNLANAGYINVGKQIVKSEGWSSITDVPIFCAGSFLFLSGTSVMAVGSGYYDFSSGPTLLGAAKYDATSGNWAMIPTTGTAPSYRTNFSAVWTGTDVIVFGGQDNSLNYLGDGARFNPANSTWNPISAVGAPSARSQHTALWTGSKMIIWGGYGNNNIGTPNGALYNPTTDSWSAISTTGTVATPSTTGNAVVWTGTEMILWGWQSARYAPTSNMWSSVPSAQSSGSENSFYVGPNGTPQAVWTGTDMLIWNVAVSQTPTPASPSYAARFTPTTNTWALVTGTGSPAGGDSSASAVAWTGSKMVVVTGSSSGGSYNPATDSWSQIASSGLPLSSNLSQLQALWSGTDVVIWNPASFYGNIYSPTKTQGGRYNPSSNSWTSILNTTVPGIRSQARSYWTGNSLLVWGGYSSSASSWLTDGRQCPLSVGGDMTDYWSVTGTTGAPTAKSAYSSVWTGSEMIVWGGSNGSTVLNTGARYISVSGTWTALPTTGAPVARSNHSAVWTGTEMIVWGGKGSSGTPLNDGGRYNPTTNAWTALSGSSAPAIRSNHSAVWTGTEMIVWGGNGNGGSYLSDGARYNLATNTWTALPSTGAPVGRINHTAAWTGNEMVIWGGETSVSLTTNTGARYNPSTNAWKTMSASGAPSARTLHMGCWITNKLVVWGGSGTPGGGTPVYGNGAYYSPVYDKWTPITTGSAPSARYGHSASLDTSNSLIYIFGGNNGANDLNDVYTYSPELDMFLYQHQ